MGDQSIFPISLWAPYQCKDTTNHRSVSGSPRECGVVVFSINGYTVEHMYAPPLKRNFPRLLVITLLGLTVSSCSINQFVLRRAGDVLAGAGTGANVFTSDDDPELIKSALPLVLKLYDALLEEDGNNPDLWLAAASGYVSYANAFLDTPAQMLPPREFEQREQKLARAKRLYLRGRDRALEGLALHDPRFLEPADSAAFAQAVENTSSRHVALLYWAAAGWLGAVAVDPFDLGTTVSQEYAAHLMHRAFALEPDFEDGAIHEFYISYYAALPDNPQEGRRRARYHFTQAVELSQGGKSSPYVSLGEAVSRREQNLEEFLELMELALAVDLDKLPQHRLVNTIRQEQAAWYRENIGRFFLDADTGMEDWEDDWDGEDW
jgi:predicted anti-sigma-YlaC factor YlaD